MNKLVRDRICEIFKTMTLMKMRGQSGQYLLAVGLGHYK